jgi:diphthamide synthase subunit DPH2
MTYLTYTEYKEIGGTLEETAFNRNIDRACAMIDNRTQSRLECFGKIPQIVKVVCADLIDYITTNTVDKPIVTSKSQSAGGVSESESYATKTADDVYGDIQNIIYDYLGNETDDNGTPLLYRGCMR